MKSFAVIAALAAAVSAAPLDAAASASAVREIAALESLLSGNLEPTAAPAATTAGSVLPTGTRRPKATGTSSRRPASTGTSPSGNSTIASTANNSGTSNYKFFQGDGSTGAGWPAESAWVSSFDSLFSIQEPALKVSCENNFKQPNNNEQENNDLKAAIQSESKSAGVDPRFTLAVVMQESKGCVRVWNTTAPGSVPINNPGLMQDHNGPHSCNTGTSSAAGKVSNPCPNDQITGMVHDGVSGTEGITGGGPGLKQLIQQAAAKGKDAQQYYIAARLYNSGSLSGSDLGAPGATRCYCSDIANRLIGWDGVKTGCTLS